MITIKLWWLFSFNTGRTGNVNMMMKIVHINKRYAEENKRSSSCTGIIIKHASNSSTVILLIMVVIIVEKRHNFCRSLLESALIFDIFLLYILRHQEISKSSVIFKLFLSKNKGEIFIQISWRIDQNPKAKLLIFFLLISHVLIYSNYA